ncbi:redoxin family protein [Thalassotalea maritima]|uniref:TlpA disulfide reductase family protein n=1 Tax=Thalassotalea maritima TaxID=3242416 RepID=UPI003529AF24
MLRVAPMLMLLLSVFSTQSYANSASIEQFKQLMQENKGKVVYIDFWASWCIPCKQSFPWMNKMQQKYAERGLKVVTINLDMERSFADEFLRQTPADFTVIYDPKSLIARKFDLKGMPSSYIYNRQGKAVKAHVGFQPERQDEYEAELVALLAQ